MNGAAPDPKMPERPRLRRTLGVVPMGADRVQLRAGDERIVVLEGEFVRSALPALLPLMDGARTTSEIVMELDGSLEASAVRDAIGALWERGLLEDGADWPDDLGAAEEATARYLTNFGLPASMVSEALRSTAILCVGDEGFAALVANEFTVHGFSRADVAGGGAAPVGDRLRETDLVVYAETAAGRFAREELNPACLETRTPWMHVSVAPGNHGVLGPLFVPPHTCCYECYRGRVRMNTAAPDELAAVDRHVADGGELHAFGGLPAHQRLMADLAVLEALKHVLRYRSPRIYNRLVTVDFLDHRSWEEPVWKYPRCPRCGAGEGG
jgi:bacteriocin biosynthesis cyclodehydratase domain-containing protein